MVGVAVCFADPEVETANDLKPIFLVEAHSFAVVFSHIKPHAGLAHLFGKINVKRKKLLPHFFFQDIPPAGKAVPVCRSYHWVTGDSYALSREISFCETVAIETIY